MEILMREHTRGDRKAGFVVERLPRRDVDQCLYVEAWRTIRDALGYRVDPPLKEGEGPDDYVSPLKRIADEILDGSATFISPGRAAEKAPIVMDVADGDLRIVNYDDDRFWVEIGQEYQFRGENGEMQTYFDWGRISLPQELKSLFATHDAAREAVKMAGYSHRLREID
jgi:hypothetical protein